AGQARREPDRAGRRRDIRPGPAPRRRHRAGRAAVAGQHDRRGERDRLRSGREGDPAGRGWGGASPWRAGRGKTVRVYGIDLGTTYSCIAYVDDVGRPSVVRLDDSDTMASVVYFERPDHVVVGESAKEALRDNPALVQSLIKRDMGKAGVTHEF